MFSDSVTRSPVSSSLATMSPPRRLRSSTIESPVACRVLFTSSTRLVIVSVIRLDVSTSVLASVSDWASTVPAISRERVSIICDERQRLLGQLVGDPGDPAREHLLHIVDDLDDRFVELIGLERHLFGERVGDPLRQLVDAFADHLAHGEDVVRQVDMHAVDGVAHLLGFADQGFALLGDAVDEAADAHLVVVVSAFERSDLVVDQGFQLRGARDRPLDAVAHGRDFAADRLADSHDRIVGDQLRFGEADSGSPHRLGDEPQFLRARHHVRQNEEEQDWRGESR